MKHVLTLAIIILFASCKHDVAIEAPGGNTANELSEEVFENISFEELNRQIIQNTNLTPKDIMKLHYAHVELGEGNEKIVIAEDTLTNGNILITLTHENIPDDAIKAEKRIMELQREGTHWKIISLKRNWKCWRNESPDNWGVTHCN